MPQTSDTEFYSLSLNSLAPPPYSSPNDPSLPVADVEIASEKSEKSFSTILVRRLTHPFSRSSSNLAREVPCQGLLWERCWHGVADLTTNWWLWELCSWLISALCIFAVALLLAYYDGRVLPDRWPLGITLNAYIAVLSGVAKYTLAVPVENLIGQMKWHWFAEQPRPLLDLEQFDCASRGPWGSIRLLLRTRGRTIASLGAIITILSLALDPFFQQLVHFANRPSALGQSAVPRMVNFTLQRNVHQNSTSGEDALSPDRLIEDVVFSFMVNNGANRSIDAFCPSEDCTWKPFDTLGMCSSCTDISSQLTLACLEESGEWRKNVTVNDNNVSKTFSCGHFLNASSQDPILMSGYSVNTSTTPAEPDEFLLMRNFNLHDINREQTYWDGSINNAKPGFPLVDFVQVVSRDVESVLANDKPVARECSIRWCTKRVVASFEKGQYKEEIISETFDESEPFDPLNISEDMDFTYEKTVSITPADSSLSFTVSNVTTLSTIFTFQDFFPSFLTASNNDSTPLLRTRNALGQPPRDWLYSANPFASWSSGNEYIKNMTDVVTNVVRAYPSSSEMFRGTGSKETFIKVRWGFLVFPLIIVMMTLAFLIAVMWNHRRHKEVGVWKSSLLASMAIGLRGDLRRSLGRGACLSDVFLKSSLMETRLQADEASGGYTLSTVDHR